MRFAELLRMKRIACAAALSFVAGAASAQVGMPDPNLREDTLSGAASTRPRVAPNMLRNATVTEIIVKVGSNNTVADGVSRVGVTVRLNDAKGEVIKTPATITIETSGGRVLLHGASTDEFGAGALDADKTIPGVQLDVENGTAVFWLVAPAKPQDVRLRVSAGRAVAEGDVSFLPELRDMIAAGLVEGVIALRSKSSNDIHPVRIDDGFEQELRAWSRTFSGDRGVADVRSAFFLKGQIQGDALLTMAFESDKDTYRRLLRDVTPDEMYPVYGDASVKSFDAQSAAKLYVRVDKGRNYLLYGDFVTAASFAPLTGTRATAPIRIRDLGQYNRTLTGAQGHFENENGSVNLFAARDTLKASVEEYGANGTSGPFAVRNSGGVLGTEKVELLTRDRNNLSVILQAVPLAQLVDYIFEPFSGRLLLTRPISSRDELGNPLSIRISYEIDQGGDPFWLYGLDGQLKLAKNFEVGGSYVDDKNPFAPYRLSSANAAARLGEHTQVVAEVARTEGDYNTTGLNGALTPGLGDVIGEASGNAMRIAVEHDDGTSTARLYAGRSDKEFNNPSASFSGGRGDAGLRATHKLNDNVTIFGEAVRSEDRVAGGTRDGAQIGSAFRVDEKLTLDVALKFMQENGLPVSQAITLPGNPSSATGTTNSPLTPSGGFFGTGSNAINPANGTAILSPQIGAASTGAGKPLDATTAQFGAQYRATPALTLSGEVEHSINGDNQERVAVGAGYQLDEGSRLYGRMETQRGLASSYSLDPADKSTWFVFGADTAVNKDTQFYSEYRLRDALGDPLNTRDAQLANGLRNTWQAAPGLRVSTGAEYLKVLDGSGQQATALIGAVDYSANPLWKGMARLEWRHLSDVESTIGSEEQDSYLSTFVVARKLDRDWTMLFRNYLLFTQFAATGDRLQDRFQVGFAYRPVDNNRINGLAKYEHKRERDESGLPSDIVGTTDSPSKRDVDIFSVLGDWHPSRPWWTTGRVAAKSVQETFDGVAVPRYTAWLLSGRTLYDVTEKFDVGVLGALLYSPDGSSKQKAVGFEVGYIVQANLRVAVGFNITGFSDRDLSGSDYTSQGVFIRLRYKFDEEMLRTASSMFERAPAATTR